MLDFHFFFRLLLLNLLMSDTDQTFFVYKKNTSIKPAQIKMIQENLEFLHKNDCLST